MNPILELKNASMIFEKRSGMFGPVAHIGAIVDVSIGVYPGEIFALDGESGCGKTTLGKDVTCH